MGWQRSKKVFIFGYGISEVSCIVPAGLNHWEKSQTWTSSYRLSHLRSLNFSLCLLQYAEMSGCAESTLVLWKSMTSDFCQPTKIPAVQSSLSWLHLSVDRWVFRVPDFLFFCLIFSATRDQRLTFSVLQLKLLYSRNSVSSKYFTGSTVQAFRYESHDMTCIACKGGLCQDVCPCCKI